ncbi:amidohydrolase [Clostridiisalibacter paucivorans]|uniref:amidohydrolase n=1 Tax=Clostridiisalibacter paucivorans TaxID=408753 RepID=UPI0006864A10|nr:amidohydrolase [Clostridiisalibacter paucivorans]
MLQVDLILYNAQIIAMNDKDIDINWVAVNDGRIIDLGIEEGYLKYKDMAKEFVNLKGKTLLPGFYDSHVHLVQTGLNIMGLNLSNVESINELLEVVGEEAKKKDRGEIIRGIGLDPLKIKEGRFPTRHELDICAPNNPVWINSIEYHTSIVNSMALHMINIPFNVDGIIRNERNIPNGKLTGKASALVRNQIYKNMNNNIRLEGVNIALNHAVEQGVTSLNALEGGATFHDKDAQFMMKNSHIFPIDITLFYQTIDVDRIIKNDLKRIGGCIFLDGSFGSRTAAISSGYADKGDTRGDLYFTQEELNEFVLEAHRNNIQVTVHAIGTRAIDQILTAYEYCQKIYPRKNHRHRIEHFEMPTEEHIERAARLNIVLSMQPAYEYYWGDKGGMYDTRLGELRQKTNPLRRILDKGLIVAGGSDSDVTPINPILGIHTAVNHPIEEHAITVYEALKMFTINGAKAVFEEEYKGSIEIGKYGDFVILNENPFKVKKDRLKDIQIAATIKEGNLLFIKQGCDINWRN